MNRLEEIKKQYAIESGSENWDDMCEYFIIGDVGGMHEAYKEVIKIYTEECVKASLEKASDRSTIFKICDDCNTEFPILNSIATIAKCPFCSKSNHIWTKINKESITNPENIILL